MAPVKKIAGENLLVQIGDGGGPETFTHDCLINTERGIQFQSDSNQEVIPDCNNPSDPGWKTLNKDGLTATITGAGMLHTPSVETWFNWFNSDDAKNCRVLLNGVLLANGGGYWAGAFKLTNFEITGPRKQSSTVSVTLVSDGAVTWHDASA
jgi:predicted secreted protein